MNQLTLDSFSSTDRSNDTGDGVGAPSCPTCGRDDFLSEKGMRRHHTVTHDEQLPYGERTCAQCGDTVQIHERARLDNDRHYCDIQCLGDWRSEHRTGENAVQWAGRETRECEQCGDDFQARPASDQRLCGVDCRGDAISEMQEGENGERIELRCDQCGVQFSRPPCDSHHRFCGRECYEQWYSETLIGPANPNWRGGARMTAAVRQGLGPRSWRAIATDVRDDAGHECEMCGGESATRALDVHHIIPVLAGGVNAPELLMALCQSCHRRAEAFIEFTVGINHCLLPAEHR